MKLTKKEAKNIVKLYNLGELIKFKLNPGGAVNYNFDFETSKGKYMIKFLSCKMTKANREKLSFEFRFLDFLEKNNFPYDFPKPIANKSGRILLKIKNHYLWVYGRISGEVIYNFDNIKEIARALSIFHKFTKKFKAPSNLKYTYIEDFLSEYSKMKNKLSKIKKPNNIDKIVISNFELFESALKKIKKMNYTQNLIITHSDFGNHNLLFENNKVKAILDFETLSLNPRIKEIAYPIKRLCFADNKLDKRKANVFLKEYEKIIKLTKKEKEAIIPMMMLDSCKVFWWVYMEMKKNPDKKSFFLNKAISKMKYLVKESKWIID